MGKGSKHINVRYFFVVDKMEKKDVKMVYYPTEKMIANYSTKPTQGSLFVYQRNTIMGAKENEFAMHKTWYEKVLRKYELWDEMESDLETI